MVTKNQLQKLCFDSKGIRGFGGKLTVGLTFLWLLFIVKSKAERATGSATPNISLQNRKLK
jgi:hypothetical protein